MDSRILRSMQRQRTNVERLGRRWEEICCGEMCRAAAGINNADYFFGSTGSFAVRNVVKTVRLNFRKSLPSMQIMVSTNSAHLVCFLLFFLSFFLSFFFSFFVSSFIFHLRLEGRYGRIRVHNIVGEINQKLSKASLSGRIITEDRRKGGIPQGLWEALSESFTGSSIVTQSAPSSCQNNILLRRRNIISWGSLPKKASHHVLKQASGLGFNELSNHIAQDSADSIETLVGGADVIEAVVI